MFNFLKTKLSFTLLAVLFTACLAFLASCGDGSTDPGGTGISGYTLSYSSVTVPRATAYPFEIIPRWNVTPSPTTPHLNPQWSNGVNVTPTVTYIVKPALPSWLGINSNTGVITNAGTPTP